MDASDPPETAIEVTEIDDGVSIALPAVGVRFASPEVKFALAFTGIVAVLIAFLLWLLHGAGATTRIVFGGGMALFAGIAAFLWFDAWRIGRRRAMIDVVGEHLLITVSAPLSRHVIETEQRFIRAIGVGPSGVVVDDEPVMALRLDLTKATRVGKANKRKLVLFRERPEADLRYVATRLREALGVETAEAPAWQKDAATSRGRGDLH